MVQRNLQNEMWIEGVDQNCPSNIRWINYANIGPDTSIGSVQSEVTMQLRQGSWKVYRILCHIFVFSSDTFFKIIDVVVLSSDWLTLFNFSAVPQQPQIFLNT